MSIEIHHIVCTFFARHNMLWCSHFRPQYKNGQRIVRFLSNFRILSGFFIKTCCLHNFCKPQIFFGAEIFALPLYKGLRRLSFSININAYIINNKIRKLFAVNGFFDFCAPGRYFVFVVGRRYFPAERGGAFCAHKHVVHSEEKRQSREASFYLLQKLRKT